MLRMTIRFLGLLLLAGVLAACSSNTVTIHGRVVDAYTNEPIEGATVQPGQRESTKTDASGSFRTTAGDADDTLAAHADGYEETTIELSDHLADSATEANPATERQIDITLRPTTLSGTVTDAATGQPIANARVQIDTGASTTTGDDGTYSIDGVPEAFDVMITAPDYVTAQASLERTSSYAVQLQPDVLRGVVTDAYTNAPIPDVTIRAGDATGSTDANGAYELHGIPDNAQITFELAGYDVVTIARPASHAQDVALRPHALAGRVVDAATGEPLADVQMVVLPAPGQSAVSRARTDGEGRYLLENVPQDSTIVALLPGYRRAETVVEPGKLATDLQLEPFEAKALYLPTRVAVEGLDAVNPYFDIIDRTELTAMVLDIKSDKGDDIGTVYYPSQVPEVVAAGTAEDRMPLREILAEAKRRNIYMIARVQIFAHDNALLQAHPDWYVQKNGQPWRDFAGMAWLDAYDERVWDYNIKLAVEAAHVGFDEIQFDYIRFPSDGNLQGAVFKGPHGPGHEQTMYETIGRVCERAHAAINDAGAFFGVDVFGYAAWRPQPGIGQNVQIMGQHVDYVYPMVYPSHYVPGTLGFSNPDEHPYEIVDHTLMLIPNQMQGAASRAKVRPWLQDFTATWIPGTIAYGPDQLRAQIDATEKHRPNGTRGWALWSFNFNYTVDGFKPQ